MDGKNVSSKEKEYSVKISELRYSGKVMEALSVCNEAITLFTTNNFFYKVKGDILFSLERYQESLDVYMLYIEMIREMPDYFTNFSKFIGKISKCYSIERYYFEKILKISRNPCYAEIIRKGTLKIVCDYWPAGEDVKLLVNTVNVRFSITNFEHAAKELREKSKCDSVYFYHKLDITNCIKSNDIVNRAVLKRLEEIQLYDNGIIWAGKILEYSNDNVIVRSLFRICRLRNDYTEAKQYMEYHDIVSNADFNIQYELVYFFDSQGDAELRNQILERMDKTYYKQTPILKTLFKFYVKYDMLDEARAIESRIDELKKTRQLSPQKQQEIIKANQDILWKKLRDLLEEQEHSRQLLAIAELIKGFSHELGQPITNIRYAIQLFYMRIEKNNWEISLDERELLDGILKQTSRIGKLLDRFSPIVSSKNKKENFCVFTQIQSIFEEMDMRLYNEGIIYNIEGDREAALFGETVQFSQVFYNLIINSIYAINKKGISGKIDVDIKLKGNELTIYFSDNGTGIEKENIHKVFEPFYSTKRKEIEEGGEGLGLYIAWNILKMFHGQIAVDPEYDNGARFIIRIKMEEADV